jgi:DNA-binding MarR family transcriptional regulator
METMVVNRGRTGSLKESSGAIGADESSRAVEPGPSGVGLGPALRRAWVGYQRRLDDEMAAAGFADRRFPDGRVLRICARSGEVTISQIGRELDMSRQGAGKIVANLRDRGYLMVRPSSTSGREKTVRLTTRATAYLDTQRKAARTMERQLRKEVGDEAFDALRSLLAALGGDEQPHMRDYLGQAFHRD